MEIGEDSEKEKISEESENEKIGEESEEEEKNIGEDGGKEKMMEEQGKGTEENAIPDVSEDMSSSEMTAMTRIQYQGAINHYQEVLQRMTDRGDLIEFVTEFSGLLQRFRSNYAYQGKLAKKNRELSNEVQVNESEKLELIESLQKETEAETLMKVHIDELREQLHLVIEEKNNVALELENLQEKIAHEEPKETEEIVHLKAEYTALKTTYAKEISLRDKEIHAEEVDLEELRLMYREKEELLKKTQAHLVSLKITQEDTVKQLARRNKQLLNMRKSLKEKDSNISHLNRLIFMKEEELSKANNAIDKLKDTRDRIQSELDTATEHLHTYRHENSELRKSLDKAMNDKEQFAADASNSRAHLSHLKEEIDKVRQERTQLRKTATDLNDMIDKWKTQNSALEHRANILSNELEESKQDCKAAQKMRDEFRKLREKEVNKNREKEERIVQLKLHNRAANRNTISLKTHLLVLQNRIVMGTRLYRRLTRQRDSLSNSKKRLEEEIERDNKRMENMRLELTIKVRELNEYALNLKKANDRYRSSEERNLHMERTLKSLQEDHENLMARFKNLELYNLNLNRHLAKQDAVVESLKTERSQLMKENSALKETKMKNVAEVDRIKEKLNLTAGDLLVSKKEMTSIMTSFNRHEIKMNMLETEKHKMRAVLTHKNEEISLLRDKVKVLESVNLRGDMDYKDRVWDIVQLKRELTREYKREKAATDLTTLMEGLRKSLAVTRMELTKEKQKTQALEQGMQISTNVHRWRILKGSDPERMELIGKNRILQKKVLQIRGLLQQKNVELKAKEQLAEELKKPLSRLSDKEAATQLLVFRRTCCSQRDKIDSLQAQLNMYDDIFSKYKSEIEELRKELNECKAKEYLLKLKER